MVIVAGSMSGHGYKKNIKNGKLSGCVGRRKLFFPFLRIDNEGGSLPLKPYTMSGAQGVKTRSVHSSASIPPYFPY